MEPGTNVEMKSMEKRSDIGGPRNKDQWLQKISDRQKEKRYIPDYLKPKIIHDVNSQFPYRCPICWEKHFHRERAEECLERCWKDFPEILFDYMDGKEREPKETGSWQWDIGTHIKGHYCGVSEYDRGPRKYFKKDTGGFTFITIDELEEILEREEIYFWQNGHMVLPDQLSRFADVPRENFEEDQKSFNDMFFGTG